MPTTRVKRHDREIATFVAFSSISDEHIASRRRSCTRSANRPRTGS